MNNNSGQVEKCLDTREEIMRVLDGFEMRVISRDEAFNNLKEIIVKR